MGGGEQILNNAKEFQCIFVKYINIIKRQSVIAISYIYFVQTNKHLNALHPSISNHLEKQHTGLKLMFKTQLSQRSIEAMICDCKDLKDNILVHRITSHISCIG